MKKEAEMKVKNVTKSTPAACIFMHIFAGVLI
jgi:hypothetical protein